MSDTVVKIRDIVPRDWKGKCCVCGEEMSVIDFEFNNVIGLASVKGEVVAHATHATESEESYKNLIDAMAKEAAKIEGWTDEQINSTT